MTKNNKSTSSGKPQDNKESCCNIESVVTVDARGQMVLPKEVREKAKIKSGDKLAVVSIEKEGKFCCISLIKTDNLSGTVKDMLNQ